MLLYVISNNLDTIYFPDEIDSSSITKLSLNMDSNNTIENVTTIIWEATDEDLFDYRINVSSDSEDRLYICSKLNSMINLIDSCCLLESISIVTIEKHYNELVNIFKDFSVPVSIQTVRSLSVPITIKTNSKTKPLCISLRNRSKPANILEYIAKYNANLRSVADYISIPLFTNYRRVEMQRLAEQSPLPILAVTAVVKHNIFTETVLFREEFTRAIDISRILKAKYVIYGSSSTKTVQLPSNSLLHYNSYNHGLRRFVAVMRDMAVYAKEFGITIIVKPNRKTKFLEDKNDLLHVINMIGCDNVTIGTRTQSNEIYTEYNDFILLESEHPSFLDVVIPKLLY